MTPGIMGCLSESDSDFDVMSARVDAIIDEDGRPCKLGDVGCHY